MNILHKYTPKKGRALVLMALALQATCHLSAMLPHNNDDERDPERSSQEAQAGVDRRRARPDDTADDNNRPLRRARLEQEAIICNCLPTHTFSEQDAPGLYIKFPCCPDCQHVGIIDYFGQRVTANSEAARPVQAREVEIMRQDPVIYEPFTPGSAVSTIGCRHTFLAETVERLRGRNCPLCRAENRNVIQRTLPLMPSEDNRLVEAVRVRLEQPLLATYNLARREYQMVYDGLSLRPAPAVDQARGQAQGGGTTVTTQQQRDLPFFQQQSVNRTVQPPGPRAPGRTYNLTTTPALQPGQNNARIQITNRIQLTVRRTRPEGTTAPGVNQEPPAPEQQ